MEEAVDSFKGNNNGKALNSTETYFSKLLYLLQPHPYNSDHLDYMALGRLAYFNSQSKIYEHSIRFIAHFILNGSVIKSYLILLLGLTLYLLLANPEINPAGLYASLGILVVLIIKTPLSYITALKLSLVYEKTYGVKELSKMAQYYPPLILGIELILMSGIIWKLWSYIKIYSRRGDLCIQLCKAIHVVATVFCLIIFILYSALCINPSVKTLSFRYVGLFNILAIILHIGSIVLALS